MADKKLFLLDGMALIYRAFFAFSKSPRLTSTGFNTSAIYGFTNTLLDVINKHNPTHIAVVFDTSAPTERHIVYEAYKAHREAMPEDLKKSIPHIFKLIEGFNIPVITLDGYEADDIIGTIAWQQASDMDVFMMTPDKDFAQLVRNNVFMYKPGRGGGPDEVLGVPEVLAKWEIERVDQVVDILGLWGDAVDNIPGVPGIGEKTAKKLIEIYGSMENILANTHELKGKQKENFEQFKQQALLSKQLATINTEVPVAYKLSDFEYEKPNENALTVIFNELEFRTMGARIFGKTSEKTPQNAVQMDLFSTENETDLEEKVTLSLDSKNTVYKLVNTFEIETELLLALENANTFAFDTETDGLDVWTCQLVGLAICTKANTGYYIPLPSNKQETLLILKPYIPFLTGSKLKVAHNAKFDMQVLSNYDIVVTEPIFDTMLAHYVLEPDMRHKMDLLSEQFLNYKPIPIEDLLGKKGKNQLNMRDIPLEDVSNYACEDADITLQLYLKFKKLLTENELENVFDKLETPLIPVLSAMEKEGICVDTNFLNLYSVELKNELDLCLNEIYELAGETFLVSSPQQVGKILFEKLQLDKKPKKTKTGQYQTDEETLAKLSEHNIVKKILDYRGITKLKSTYVDALPQLLNQKTQRIHTSFNQTVAATGRLSSNNPNLQNIPIRTEMGKEVRKAFIPRDKDHVIVSADYSQIELRIIAHVSGDKGMIEAFNMNLDIHTATAAKVFGIDIKDVTSEMRRKAKTVNFGIIYGISAFGLSQRIGISRSESKEIIDNYFEKFPGVKTYMETTINYARQNGFVKTLLGRRRYIRDINSTNAVVKGFAERNAINAPIQGSAADMIKIAMIDIHNWLKTTNLKSKMILQVHDELLFDVPKNEVAILLPKVKELMSKAMVLNVPVLVEASQGNNWLEAH